MNFVTEIIDRKTSIKVTSKQFQFKFRISFQLNLNSNTIACFTSETELRTVYKLSLYSTTMAPAQTESQFKE